MAEIEFSAEQQALVDRLVGDARVKAREQGQAAAQAEVGKTIAAAEKQALEADAKWEQLARRNEARIKELEPLEVQAKAYGELVAGMLTERVKALGDAAGKAVKAMPEAMTDEEKLHWLNANTDLFRSQAVGTPQRPKTGQKKVVGKVSKYPLTL